MSVTPPALDADPDNLGPSIQEDDDDNDDDAELRSVLQQGDGTPADSENMRNRSSERVQTFQKKKTKLR